MEKQKRTPIHVLTGIYLDLSELLKESDRYTAHDVGKIRDEVGKLVNRLVAQRKVA